MNVWYFIVWGKISLWKGYSIEKYVKLKVDEINLKMCLVKIKFLNWLGKIFIIYVLYKFKLRMNVIVFINVM